MVKHRFCTGAPEVNAVRGCKLEVEAAGGVARRYYTAPHPPPLVPMRTMEECAMAFRKLSIYSTLCRAGRSSFFFVLRRLGQERT